MLLSRKVEILDALIEIFRNQGIGTDFTMSQLAQQVNIGKSTIYEYFKTKEDVLQQAIYRVMDLSLETIQNRPLEQTTFERQLEDELKQLFSIAINSRFLFNLVSPGMKRIMPEEHRKEMRDKVERITVFYRQRFETIFMTGVEEGLLDPELLQENHLLISSLVTGSILQFANAKLTRMEDLDVDRYILKMYHAIIKLAN